jgi:beta-glucanase (GH16 family)
VFQEDFDGTSLDEKKWSTGNHNMDGRSKVTPPVNSDELNCYDSDLVGVSNGSLHIRAIRKTETCGDRTMPYTSGMINTKKQFRFTYGALEARMHLPAAEPGVIANWPVFWQLGANWPIDGESDVVEGLLGHACFHYHSKMGSEGGCAKGDYTGWHTFGAHWRPGRMDYYYDGVLVGTLTENVTAAPQWLVLTYSVQPSVGGPTKVPSDLRVDYVRVWQSTDHGRPS